MDMLQKLMQEKMKKGEHSADSEMDPRKKTAMLGILDHISRMAEGAMGDDMNHELSQQVTVAAGDRKGLKSGLDEAKKLVDKKGEPLRSNSFDNTPGSDEQSHELAEGHDHDMRGGDEEEASKDPHDPHYMNAEDEEEEEGE